MDEVAIPLALLVMGTTAILWEMARGEWSRHRGANAGSATDAPEREEETEGTEAMSEPGEGHVD